MEQFNFDKIIASLRAKDLDLTERTIPFNNGMIKLFFIIQLTDRTALAENVMKPLVLQCSSSKKVINAKETVEGIIFAEDCQVESSIDRIEEFILSGMVVILFSNDNEYIVVNLRKVAHRAVPTPQLNYTARGPQDSFVENLDVNLSLIRYRIKDENLQIKKYELGARTKSRVAVIYIKDIANNIVVDEIQKRIQNINVDGIGESAELQAFLLNNKMELLPNMGIVERSDMASHSLLEGKVIVLVDGSGLALLAPKIFIEFFYSCDDRYDNKFFAVLMRIVRYIAFFLAFTSSSIFVALTAFHTDVLPSMYAITLAEMRIAVPFSIFIEVLIIEIIIELLRESLLRVPRQIGSAVGIVGAIIIGDAAISAGFFNPLLLIVMSTSLLASFAMPDYTLMTPFRVLKFGLLFSTAALGFYGFTLFITFVLIELVSLNSFGVPYFAPFAPFDSYDFKRTIMNNITIDPKRPKYLRTKDKNRTSG